MICLPSHTPIKHPITLNPIYNNETPYFPISIKFIASNENVEKVVKPPQTPVFKNNVIDEDIFSLSAKPTTIPINNAPNIFVIKVKIGKSFLIGKQLIPCLLYTSRCV